MDLLHFLATLDVEPPLALDEGCCTQHNEVLIPHVFLVVVLPKSSLDRYSSPIEPNLHLLLLQQLQHLEFVHFKQLFIV